MFPKLLIKLKATKKVQNKTLVLFLKFYFTRYYFLKTFICEGIINIEKCPDCSFHYSLSSDT